MDAPPFWSGNQDELDRAFKGDETQPSLVEQLLGDVLSRLDLLQQTLVMGAHVPGGDARNMQASVLLGESPRQSASGLEQWLALQVQAESGRSAAPLLRCVRTVKLGHVW